MEKELGRSLGSRARGMSIDWLSLFVALTIVALVRAGLIGKVPW